jgi:hypothetical protein
MNKWVIILIPMFLLALVSCSISSETPIISTTTPPATTTRLPSESASLTPDNTHRLTMEEASMALVDRLASIARSPRAKQVLADFYDNFNQQEIYIWVDNKLIEVNYDSRVAAIDFDYWEIAHFPLPRDPNVGEFPEYFLSIFSYSEEIIHPAQDGVPEEKEITIALRWYVDSHTGEVKTTNPNALRLEAELSK